MKAAIGFLFVTGAWMTFAALGDSSAGSSPSPQTLVENETKRYIKANLLKPGWIIESNVEVRPLVGDPRYVAFCAAFKNDAAYRAAMLHGGRNAGMVMHRCIVSVSGVTATVNNCSTEK